MEASRHQGTVQKKYKTIDNIIKDITCVSDDSTLKHNLLVLITPILVIHNLVIDSHVPIDLGFATR